MSKPLTQKQYEKQFNKRLNRQVNKLLVALGIPYKHLSRKGK